MWDEDSAHGRNLPLLPYPERRLADRLRRGVCPGLYFGHTNRAVSTFFRVDFPSQGLPLVNQGAVVVSTFFTKLIANFGSQRYYSPLLLPSPGFFLLFSTRKSQSLLLRPFKANGGWAYLPAPAAVAHRGSVLGKLPGRSTQSLRSRFGSPLGGPKD